MTDLERFRKLLLHFEQATRAHQAERSGEYEVQARRDLESVRKKLYKLFDPPKPKKPISTEWLKAYIHEVCPLGCPPGYCNKDGPCVLLENR